MKRWLCLGALVILAAMAALVMLNAGRPSVSTDSGGRMRIVSLAPSITEMLFALGLGDFVVGVTEYCTYPPEALKIERVGGFATPNIEKVLSLRPTLVVGGEGARADVVRTVQESGARVLELRAGNFEELFDSFIKIGDATGTAEKARAVVAGMRADLDAAAERFRDVPHERRPRVYVEIWYDPITTAGGKSFIDDVVSRAGGVNVARGLAEAHPRVNPEKVIEWNPEVIIVCYMARGEMKAEFASRIGWKDVAAVRNERIISDISSDHMLRPGPRLVEGVVFLAERLYPHGAEKAEAGEEGR